MKKQFIKFSEGCSVSLKKATDEAERLGYIEIDNPSSKYLKGNGVLRLGDDGKYWSTNYTQKELINLGYVEHKLLTNYKRGDVVLVRSNNNQSWKESIFLTEIKGVINPFICVYGGSEEAFKKGTPFGTSMWKRCKPLEKKKIMTIAEIEKELGYGVLISKEK